MSFAPAHDLENEFSLRPLRAAFADRRESRFRMAVPVLELRRLLDPPVPVSNVLQFSRLNWTGNEKIEPILDELFCFLPYSVGTRNQHIQLKLFDHTTRSRLVYASRTNESPEPCAHFRVSWNEVFVT